jgi:transposase
MARPLYVRDLTVAEGRRLQRLMKYSRDPVAVHRAQILLASDQGFPARQVALRLGFSERYVRKVVHAFNQGGLASVPRQWKGGRKPDFSRRQRRRIATLAKHPPQGAGYPFTRWSLSKLATAARELGIVQSISLNTVDRILKEQGVSLQRTRTWKVSQDPHFRGKNEGSGA